MLALNLYDQLVEGFGWAPFKKVFAEYRDLPKTERPKNDAEKLDQWCVRFSKATGTGLRAPVSLRNIAVLRDPRGKPFLQCAPELNDWLAARGVVAHHVSLSDESDLVLAYVILETT